jgi:alpha-L-arabinofuranosidase
MQVTADWNRSAGTRGDLFFGYFLEHFHRQVYGGAFDPGSPLADEHGFRRDVLDAVRRLRPAVIRWPGGCFASAYHWRDGVGGDRRPRYDKAWRVTDPNTFGTDEFLAYCRLAGAQPYLCGNAGTGTPEDMSDWVEYCNLPADASGPAADRARHGHPDPYGVTLWSIGNENYGDWELGAHEAAAWGPYVREAAKLMRRVDDRLILAAPGFVDFEWNLDLLVDWNLGLLRAAGSQLDLLAIHGYAVLEDGAGYLEALAHIGFAESRLLRAQAALDLLGLTGQVKIAFDEWNPRGWHFPGFDGRARPDLTQWQRNDRNATYTMADALLHAGFLNTCLRQADTVAMTNMSPLVNARGPIYAHPGGIVLRPTYHVCELYAAQLAREVLDTRPLVPGFDVPGGPAGGTVTLPRGDALVTADRATGEVAVSLSNLHPDEPLDCVVWLPGRMLPGPAGLTTLTGPAPDSYNDVDRPDDVCPRHTQVPTGSDAIRLRLPPHSVSILRVPTVAGPGADLGQG